MTIRTYQYAVTVLVTPSSGSDVTRSVAQALGLSDAVSEAVFGVIVEQDLGLSDLADQQIDLGGQNNLAQALGLSDEAISTMHPHVQQGLGLSDVAASAIAQLEKSVSHSLGLLDEGLYRYGVRNLIVDQDLGLSDSAGQVVQEAITDNLGLTDYASWTDIVQDLGLSDDSEWGYGFDASNSLGVSDLAEVDQILIQDIAQDAGIVQAVAWYVESSCSRFEFKQFHGEGGVAPAEERLTYDSQFLLQSLDDATIVSLRNPETDDTRRTAYNRVNRSFFDGTPDIYVESDWAVQDSQLYTLTATKRADLDSVQTFLLDNLGRDILLKDWRGVTWRVIVTNVGDPFTEDGEGYWTLEFEVEGNETDGEVALQMLGVDQEISRAGSIWTRTATNDLGVTQATVVNIVYAKGETDNVGLTDNATRVVI